jgi:hypothetical protein
VFYERGKVLCEAASGYFLDEPRTMYLPRAAIAALGRLGFSTDDSKSNFRIDLDVTTPPDFGALAELMLKALHAAYGVRARDMLEFDAPYAPDPAGDCVPVS